MCEDLNLPLLGKVPLDPRIGTATERVSAELIAATLCSFLCQRAIAEHFCLATRSFGVRGGQ